MQIPTHYFIAGVRIEKCGGNIIKVRLELPRDEGFSRRFGRRIRNAGGSYTLCVEHAETIRYVDFPWQDGREKLLSDLLHHYCGAAWVTLLTAVSSHSEHEVMASTADLLAAVDSRLQRLFEKKLAYRTKEEAQLAIDTEHADTKAKHQKWRRDEAAQRDLVQVCSDLGFCSSKSDRLYFDQETATRFSCFLQQATER